MSVGRLFSNFSTFSTPGNPTNPRPYGKPYDIILYYIIYIFLNFYMLRLCGIPMLLLYGTHYLNCCNNVIFNNVNIQVTCLQDDSRFNVT